MKVQPGDIVVEVEAPDEDGYVLVQNDEGKVGSIAVNCAGKTPGQVMIISDVPIRGDHQEDDESHPGEEADRSPRSGGGRGRHPGAAGAS